MLLKKPTPQGNARFAWPSLGLQWWPWSLLAVATLIFSIYYVPGYFLSAADTETTMLAVFYHDTIELHHPFADWGWGGFSGVFPDVIGFFALNYLCHDGLLALKLVSIFYFVGWLTASACLAVVLRRPYKLALFSMLFLLWLGEICNFGLPFDWGLHLLNPLFASMYHSGTGLLTLVCLILLLDQISDGRKAGAWLLFTLIFLGGASDILFFIDFVGPALLVLVLLALWFQRDWKKYIRMALAVTAATIAAYFLGPSCFPVVTSRDQYIHLSFFEAVESFLVLFGELSQPEHHFFIFTVALDILTVLGCFAGLLFFYFSQWRQRASSTTLALLIFCAATILADWFTTLFTGLYSGMYANRYLAVALTCPLLLGTFAFHAIIPWRPWLEKLCAVGISVFAIHVAFIPQPAHPDYQAVMSDLPFMEKLVKERQLGPGLGDYWKANIFTFLSHWKVRLLSVTGDGEITRPFCSLEWFGKGRPFNERPHIRMIYLPDPYFAHTFGPPDEIVYTPQYHDAVWIYSQAHAIMYSDFFDALSNRFLDEGRTLSFDISSVPSRIGTIQDHSRLATEGRDPEGVLSRASVVLPPAHYRFTWHYAYLAPPAADKLSVCDLVASDSHKEAHESNKTPLPYQGAGPQFFSRDFVAAQPDKKFILRIFYRGSGTIRVDSLTITYLRP